MGTTQEQENTNQQFPQKYSSRNRGSEVNPGVNDGEGFLSPGFRSVAAMAGWDEEALLLASLVVEDTPERGPKEKKRPELQFITPPTNSRRKRRTQRRSPVLIQCTILNLDDEEFSTNIASIPATTLDLDKEDVVNKKDDKKVEAGNDLKKEKKDELAGRVESSSASSESSSTLPNIDKLRDELSCAICLEVCFEPSTTPCGHSFCKKCLRSAADKCGKRCPKCRQLISNGRSYTVNTVLWNTIQLIFPTEVEARKAAGALNTRELERQNTKNLNLLDQNTATTSNHNNNYVRLRRIRHARSSSSTSSGEDVSTRSNSRAPLQDEDAALALRLQREEFMQAHNRPPNPNGEYRSSVSMARANLRAMASRAISLRTRNRSMYN